MIRNLAGVAVLVGAAVVGLAAMPATSEAGVVKGPQTRKGTLAPNDKQDTFAFEFKGGELATIIVNNKTNKGNVNLVVEDDNGNVVAKDFRPDDDASVAFKPKHTGTYYVKLKYKGKGKIHYTLTTN